MTTELACLLAAAAVLLVPGLSSAVHRADALAVRGRLGERVRAARAWPGWLRRVALTPVLITCGAGVAVATAASGGLALGIAVAGVLAAIGSLVRAARGTRRATCRERDLRTAVGLIVAELECGSTSSIALAAAADAKGADWAVFAAAAGQARLGAAIAPAFIGADTALHPIGHAWAVVDVAGAPPAEVLARVDADLAATQQQRRAVASALAGPRSSALMLAGLPLLGVVLGAAMGADPLKFLLGAPAGRIVCCVGALFDACGVWWTQRLLAAAMRA